MALYPVEELVKGSKSRRKDLGFFGVLKRTSVRNIFSGIKPKLRVSQLHLIVDRDTLRRAEADKHELVGLKSTKLQERAGTTALLGQDMLLKYP